MKTIKLLLAGVLFACLTSLASAQTVINVTGATAFRAAAHDAIIAILGGQGTTQYAFTGTQGIGGANKAIFSGNLAGVGSTIVRTTFSGSTQGIADVAQNNNVNFLPTSTTRTTAGNNVADASDPAQVRFAFSDVFQASATVQSPVLEATPVGVIPFVWLANNSAPATLNNMTDQIHEALYSQAILPLSFFTGVETDTTNIYPTGRNAGSGSRATMLAETGYGVFRGVQQYTGTFSGSAITNLTFVGNGGYSSNSGIRDLLTKTSGAVSVDGGAPESLIVVGYLTIPDALAALGAGTPAREMFYNGSQYSLNNVINGKYTLWGYEILLNRSGLTAAESTFRTALINTIPTTLTPSTGVPIPDMNVTRFGGDGGLVSP